MRRHLPQTPGGLQRPSPARLLWVRPFSRRPWPVRSPPWAWLLLRRPRSRAPPQPPSHLPARRSLRQNLVRSRQPQSGAPRDGARSGRSGASSTTSSASTPAAPRASATSWAGRSATGLSTSEQRSLRRALLPKWCRSFQAARSCCVPSPLPRRQPRPLHRRTPSPRRRARRPSRRRPSNHQPSRCLPSSLRTSQRQPRR
mmetsp:Transcript_105879/g.316218  ORF Transcript_105879/g.316218 Transcript_105879/m.316218 type:complete len:200 (-) Transcript_105879:321-920(-)